MRGQGINYDTGFYPGGVSTREHFDPVLVGREMRVIAYWRTSAPVSPAG